MTGRVGVVIVNWNGWRDTLACLDSLERSRYRDILPIVVDNASSDESRDMFDACPHKASFLYSPTNAGWSGGNNAGIRHALDAGCDYIYLLNNDAVVAAEAIGALIAIAADTRFSDYGVLGSLVESEVASDSYEFSGTVVDDYSHLPSGMGHSRSTPLPEGDVLPVAFVKGCSLFFHRSLVDLIGLIDDRYYLNYDETDFCYRARSRGRLSGICPASRIIHKGGATIGGLRSPLSLYFLTRNRLLFAEKHLGLRRWFRIFAVTLIELRTYRRSIAARAPAERGPLAFQYQAARRGLVDYGLRRFGNCPDRIRLINRSWREAGGA